MKIYKNIQELIGNTPMFELVKIKKVNNLNANLYAKLEYFNPAGSVKDRVADAMIDKAEKMGLINKDTILIEPTSGNTGIGLAMVSASKGYKLIITMPETMSAERINLMKAYGAEIVLTDGNKGMKGAIEKAEELKQKYKNSFIPSQFENIANSEIHKKTTAVEIYNDLDGNIDIFVAGVGTGGTITGIGEYLKSKNKTIKIVAVEPFDSPILSKGISGSHKIQGIGAGFIPKVLNTNIYDEIITVKNEDAFEMGRNVVKIEGIFVGISSGAVLQASIELAKRSENAGKNIVMLFPDSGDRYLTTDMFNDK